MVLEWSCCECQLFNVFLHLFFRKVSTAMVLRHLPPDGYSAILLWPVLLVRQFYKNFPWKSEVEFCEKNKRFVSLCIYLLDGLGCLLMFFKKAWNASDCRQGICVLKGSKGPLPLSLHGRPMVWHDSELWSVGDGFIDWLNFASIFLVPDKYLEGSKTWAPEGKKKLFEFDRVHRGKCPGTRFFFFGRMEWCFFQFCRR